MADTSSPMSEAASRFRAGAVALLGAGAALCAVSAAYTRRVGASRGFVRPSIDVVHEWIAPVPLRWQRPWIHDYALYLSFFVAAACLARCAQQRLDGVCWFAGLYGALLVGKAATMAATVVESPLELCRDAETRPSVTDHACNDLMYSGHTCGLILCLLFVNELRAVPAVVKLVFAAWTVVGCAIVVGTRQHYSADCIVAIIVTVLAFGNVREGVGASLNEAAAPPIKTR